MEIKACAIYILQQNSFILSLQCWKFYALGNILGECQKPPKFYALGNILRVKRNGR